MSSAEVAPDATTIYTDSQHEEGGHQHQNGGANRYQPQLRPAGAMYGP